MLLDIKVIDPASGSGHFLIAAAHRLAAHLARIRNQDQEPSPAAHREALRDVVRHCIYGVDINPMAVELCKVGLWLESLDPGKPLTFLDRNIQCGNSLVGVTPGLDISIIPDDAFKPVTGDDKKTATALRRRNKRERQGQQSMFEALATGKGFEELEQERKKLADKLAEVEDIPEDDLEDVALKAMYYHDYLNSPVYRRKKDEYDLWTAAFFWPIPAGDAELMLAPTQAVLDRLRDQWNPDDPVVQQARTIAQENQFFHWELAFPTVFGRDAGGFDVVLGNPPWDQIQTDAREFFAVAAPRIAEASTTAARNRMINELATTNPELFHSYQREVSRVDRIKKFVHGSGVYPLTSFGRLNTAPLFAELSIRLLSKQGRTGIIVPTGIATDSFNQYFFRYLVNNRLLVSLYDFENRKAIFPAVHRSYKFCLLTLTGPDRPARQGADFVFFAQDVADLRDEHRHFTLTAEDIELINPNTRTCPIFRSKRDAELTKAIYRRVPVLIVEEEKDGQGQIIREEQNPWGIKFMLMFMMNTDSHLFRIREQLEAAGYRLVGNRFVKGGGASGEGRMASGDEAYLPLYEAKMFHHFDHRWATYDNNGLREVTIQEKSEVNFVTEPKFWVAFGKVVEKFQSEVPNYLLGYRAITNATNERSVVAAVIPFSGAGNSSPILELTNSFTFEGIYLESAFNSFVLDFVARNKIGGTNFNMFILKQLPIFPPEIHNQGCPWYSIIGGTDSSSYSPVPRPPFTPPHSPLAQFLLPRVLELTYTAWDLAAFGRDVIIHWQNQVASGQWPVPPGETDPRTLHPTHHSQFTTRQSLFPPYRWDEERRFLIRCELDAAYFHLYGIARDDVDYIMDTFPIVKRKDEAAHGEYRTKRVILEIYDAMARAMETGEPYRTLLDPPPGHPSQRHTGPVPEWVELVAASESDIAG